MSKNVEEVEAGDNLDGHIANIHYLEEEIRNEEYVSNCMAFLHFVNEETVNICTNNIDQSST